MQARSLAINPHNIIGQPVENAARFRRSLSAPGRWGRRKPLQRGHFMDASGNLYGTTTNGGDDEGVVYEITP